jgi:tRNA A37 methylthiotransferase MiaB
MKTIVERLEIDLIERGYSDITFMGEDVGIYKFSANRNDKIRRLDFDFWEEGNEFRLWEKADENNEWVEKGGWAFVDDIKL